MLTLRIFSLLSGESVESEVLPFFCPQGLQVCLDRKVTEDFLASQVLLGHR